MKHFSVLRHYNSGTAQPAGFDRGCEMPGKVPSAMFEPLAVEIYRQHLSGKTIPQLAAEYGIPVGRIEPRIKAAAKFLAAQPHGRPETDASKSRGGVR